MPIKKKLLRLLALTFQIYTVEACIIYIHWRPLMPGRPGMIGGYYLTRWLTGLALGYLISFFALFVIAVLQMRKKNYWMFMLNVAFALFALFMFFYLNPPYLK